jgi:ABC-type glycerol-3-phosphate transport system substrate-binding protein
VTRQLSLRTAGAIALAAVVAAAAGCGGSSSSSSSKTTTSSTSGLESWANSLCSAVTTYKASLATIGVQLKAEDLSRPALQVAVLNARTATSQFANAVGHLGPPPTPNATGAKKILTGLQADLKQDANQVKALSSGNPALKTAKSTITSALNAAGDQISQAVDQLRQLDPKETWGKAFDNATACKSLG